MNGIAPQSGAYTLTVNLPAGQEMTTLEQLKDRLYEKLLSQIRAEDSLIDGGANRRDYVAERGAYLHQQR